MRTLSMLAFALAATAANAFAPPPAARAFSQGNIRAGVASRPAQRGVASLRAVYEPAIRIGHGFDIHRLGECAGWVCVLEPCVRNECVCLSRSSKDTAMLMDLPSRNICAREVS